MTERVAFNRGGAGRSPFVAARRRDPRAEDGTAPASDRLPTERARAQPDRSDWPFRFTLLFTAIVFLRPQDIFPPLNALHLAELAAIGGLGTMIFARLRRGQSITRMTPELAAILVLGGLMLVLAPFSIWLGGVVQTFNELYSKIILIYLLTINVLTSPRRIERLTWILVLTSGYIGFRATLDYVRGVNLIAHGTRVMGSVGGIMQNPNDLALNMVAILPFAIFFAVRRDTLPKRLFAAICAAVMVCAIVATGSRGGFIGFVMMMLLTGATTIRRKPGYAIAGVLIFMCALPIVPQQYWVRLSSMLDEKKDEYGTLEARRTLLKESWQAYLENPITGVGAGQFKNWNPEGREQAWHESHDVWLQVASELGTAGLIVFVYLVGRGVLAVWRTRRLIARLKPSRKRRRRAGRFPQAAAADAAARPLVTEQEWNFLDAHSAAMMASIIGWIVCASFASVAYNWTFYYLLVLAVAPRDILRARLAVTAPARASAAPFLRPEVARA
jgi:O-antigen ligase